MFLIRLNTLIFTLLTLLVPRVTNAFSVREFAQGSPQAQPGTPVTAAARTSDTLDLFVVGRDGRVYTTNWSVRSGWAKQWIPLQDKAYSDRFTVPPQSTVTAVSRTPDSLDLFVVGYDGRIFSGNWNTSSGWSNQWVPLQGKNFSNGFVVPKLSAVSVVSRTPDSLDLFVVGPDGRVYTTNWNASSGWFDQWFALQDNTFPDGFTVTPQSPISAVSRTPDSLDLFVVGRDGRIFSTKWDASGGWANQWVPLQDKAFPDGFTALPKTTVTAVSRTPDSLDLFVVGRDGRVYAGKWNASGWSNQWLLLQDKAFADGFTVLPQTTVTAVSRTQDSLDVFVVGRDGRVYTTSWNASSGWSNQWLLLQDKAFADGFTVLPQSTVSAVSRTPDSLDVFVVGHDGHMYTTTWSASSGWSNQWSPR